MRIGSVSWDTGPAAPCIRPPAICGHRPVCSSERLVATPLGGLLAAQFFCGATARRHRNFAIMRGMPPPLMLSRRFAPLFWCQFFSAFSDNFLKNALVFLILFK